MEVPQTLLLTKDVIITLAVQWLYWMGDEDAQRAEDKWREICPDKGRTNERMNDWPVVVVWCS